MRRWLLAVFLVLRGFLSLDKPSSSAYKTQGSESRGFLSSLFLRLLHLLALERHTLELAIDQSGCSCIPRVYLPIFVCSLSFLLSPSVASFS